MRALFDTNILLDIGLARKPFAESAFACLAVIREIGEFPCFAPHSLATFYYIVAQAHGSKRAITATQDIIATGEVVPFDHKTARRSMALAFGDFEDAMVAAAAEASGMEWIVTRNLADFEKSPVKALSPEAFLGQLSS